MEFGQLIEYNEIKYFSSKLWRGKRGRETSCRPIFFLKFRWGKSKWPEG